MMKYKLVAALSISFFIMLCGNVNAQNWDKKSFKEIRGIETLNSLLDNYEFDIRGLKLQKGANGLFPRKGYRIYEHATSLILADEPTGVIVASIQKSPSVKKGIIRISKEVKSRYPNARPLLLFEDFSRPYEAWKKKGKAVIFKSLK